MGDPLRHLAEWQLQIHVATLNALVDAGRGWNLYTMRLADEIADMCEHYGIELPEMVSAGRALLRLEGKEPHPRG